MTGGLLRQYGWIFNLLAILLCSFFMAKIAGVYIAKQLEVSRSIAVLSRAKVPSTTLQQGVLEDYKIVIDRNIFDSSEVPEEKKSDEKIAEEIGISSGEAVLTSLSITVLGVLVVGDGRDSRSSATVQSTQGKQGGDVGVYAVGDPEGFAPNIKLTRIAPDRIEFLNAGRLEYAEVGGDFGESIFGPPKRDATVAAVPKSTDESGDQKVLAEAPGKYVIDQSEVDNALQNLDKLYTEIRAVPNFSGGKVSGMKILSVQGGSIFAKLGLKRGDVLQRINGLELDVKQGFAIFGQLKDSKSLTLDLIRLGQPQTIEYEIR